MSKDRTFRQKRKKATVQRIGAAVVAALLVVVMAVGLIPKNTVEVLAADKTMNMEGFSATLIADPHTSEDDHIFNGTPAEDGKIWTDKSVTTGAMYGLNANEEHFTVALSALAQTYSTVTTGMSTEQQNVAYDVVFVLDFSASMNERTSGNSSPYRAQAMVDALNPAISTLMENDNSRIAVIGYSGSSLGTEGATTLLDLNHYTTTTTDGEGNNLYFEYITSGTDRIATVGGVSNGTREVSASKNVTGGTPTQRGIYRAMDLLQNAEKPDDDVVRIPIVVLLSDGEAGRARSNYRTLSGGTLYEGTAANGSSNNNDEVGAYTALTANYAKTTINELYKDIYDYTNILASGDPVAKFYSIGLGITENSWAHAMLDPGILTDPEVNITDNTANNLKEILENDTTYGPNNYDYADMYFGGEDMTAEDLDNAFEKIVSDLQVAPQISTTVNDPVTTETTSVTGNRVSFTDYLGYKMELKGDSQYLRYKGVNYRFDKQADNTYVFSGYNQEGAAVTGPVITKGDSTYTLSDVEFKAEYMSEEAYNGQTGYWKITWSFPGAMLPTYSRLTDYDNTDLEPIRMLYEVGLAEDVNLWTDGLKIGADGELLPATAEAFDKYVFHTNLYNYAKEEAMTWSTYTPAKDNPYYYETGYTTSKTEAGYAAAEDTAEYVRLDMTAIGTKMGEIEGSADVALSNISVSLRNARASFTYNNVTYNVDLTGDSTDGAKWTGQSSIPVVGQTAEGQEITTTATVHIEATYNDGWWMDSLELSAVTINGELATLNNSRTTATKNDLTILTWGEVPDQTTEEVVSVYMELKQDDAGYYVEDAKGNRIDVTKENNVYKITLDKKVYYSNLYYKYEAGTESYVEKQLGKGAVAKSLVGQFKINQPTNENFTLTEDNIASIFQYYPSNYNEKQIKFDATRVIIDNGDDANRVVLGTPIEADYPISTVDGTVNVCVDGIKNGQLDINGKEMEVHFDFVLEEQTLENGKKQYALLDCYYWDKDDTYSVDVIASETPDINGDEYSYDISYTIESTHPAVDPAKSGNLTQTDIHFFNSKFDAGQMLAHLGNNGRVSVNLSDAYEKSVTVQKEWFDRLGNKLDNSSAALQNASVTAGIYQVYSYVDENNETQSQNGTNGVPFATAVLNQANDFTYTWTTPALPKYLVSEGGDNILDKDGNKVEVTYIAGEAEGADGWTLSEVVDNSTETEDIYTLQNVPLAEFSPTVQKVWSNTETGEAPEGYKIKIELLADGEPVYDTEKIDAEHVITAKLEQASANGNATLHIDFGSVSLGSQEVQLVDFGEENTMKSYEFEYEGEDGQGVGGEVGSGSHADKVTIKATVSNTGGAKLSVSDVEVIYHYTEAGTGAKGTVTMQTFRSNSVTDGDVKTYTYVMSYGIQEKAEVILDGVVDSAETKAWYSELNKWNLPMLHKDPDTGSYTAIPYSVRETLYVPDANGTETLSGETQTYKAYTVENGFITVPLGGGDNQVFKVTYAHTTDYHFTVTNEESRTNITAEKVWQDNDNKYETRPEKITFQLKADGQTVATKELTATGDTASIWNGTADVEWKNVPLYNTTTGAKIVYTVEETITYSADQTDRYKTVVTTDPENANHFIVTNSLHADPAINYTFMDVEKKWVDDGSDTRPANLYMVLYRTVDEEGAATEIVPGAAVVVLSGEGDTWSDTTTWQKLAKYNEDGKLYIYSVREYASLSRALEGASGYENISTVVSNNGTKYTFTNQLADGAISKTVTKSWKDAALENQRPEKVTVLLSASVDGASLDLTNYVPSDGTSSQAVNYQPEKTLDVSSWSYTWNNLPEYYNGKKIDYTITETKVGDVTVEGTEVAVNGATYTITVQDDGSSNEFVVTNRLTGETSVTVTKEWDVSEAPQGFEIPEVTFDVYNRFHGKLDGKYMTVTKDNLTASVTGLPKYNADGAEYVYTVEERPIAGTEKYVIESVISSNTDTSGNFAYTATNTYVPLIQDVTGTKTWIGVAGDNIPESITVELYRQYGEGEPELVVGQDNAALQPTWVKSADEKVWTYTYKDLVIYEDNNTSRPYVYSMKETMVDNTAVEVKDGKRIAGDFTVKESGLNITNTLGGTVDGKDLAGTKTWVAVEDANVPDSISVQLMRNITNGAIEPALDTDGDTVVITVKKEDQSKVKEWTYDFDGNSLPKYDAEGNRYIYSVKEVSVTAGSTTRTVEYSSVIAGTVGDYTVSIAQMNITNTLKGDSEKDKSVDFPITKMWAIDNNTTLPGSITIQLLKDGKSVAGQSVQLTSAYEDQSNKLHWLYTFEKLNKYTDNGITEAKYTITETKIGNVNVVDGKADEWSVGISPNGDVIINSREDASTTLTVEKKWQNVSGENIPDVITVQLYQNDVKLGTPVELTKDSGWRHEFPYLPVSSDGTTTGKHIYTVREESVTADGVTETVTGNRVGDYIVTYSEGVKLDPASKNTFTVTNTLNTDDNKVKIDYPVEKTWENVTDTSKYTIQVQLFRDGTAMDGANYVKTLSSNSWEAKFAGLDKYTANGITQYVYTARETTIGITVDGDVEYTSVNSGKAGDFFVTYTKQDKEGTIINNRLATEGVDKELINYSVNKKWLKNNAPITENLPASITVQLQQDGTVYGDAYIFSADDIADDWTHTFTKLRKYADDGLTPYEYSAIETKVGSVEVVNKKVGAWSVTYDIKATNTTITNTLEDVTRKVVVKKQWEQVSGDNIPDAVAVELHGGEDIQYKTITATDNWECTFANLPVYHEDGITKYTYTVKEASVSEGSVVASVVYKSSTEGAVGDYTVALSGTMEDGFTITNTLKQGNDKDLSVNYTVTKRWDVPYGATLPESITVALYQEPSDGNSIATAEITAADNWTHTFNNLRKYTDNGITEYVYSVKETKVGSANVTDNKAGAYTVSIVDNVITNTLSKTPGDLNTSLTVTKEWVNVKGDNIPDIEIQLLRDGKEYKEVVISRETLEESAVVSTEKGEKWTYTFTNLPRYSDGIIPYVYTVKEAYVGSTAVVGGTAGDYKVTVNGNEITNTLTGTLDSIKVQKIWKDKAEESNRPDTIKVAVVRKIEGGQYVNAHGTDTFTLSKDNQWTATFNNGTGYPKYDEAGNLYTYRVVEVDASGNFITDGKKITYGNLQYEVDNQIDSDGTFTITNTLFGEYIPNTETEIKVTKNWLDDKNSQGKRPTEISVKLYQEGVATELEILTVTGSSQEKTWTKAFTKTYPMYDKEGALITYRVDEKAIPDYTLKSNTGNAKEGFELTNVYTPGMNTVVIHKVWVDNNNELGKRPADRLTLNLLQNGKEYRHVVLNASSASTWTATQDVPAADEEGKLYVYSIVEPDDAVDAEYTAKYTNSSDGLTVTNTLTCSVKVSGTKLWEKIEESYRPESVTVELWRKTRNTVEEKIAALTTDADKGWKYDFGELPKYDANGALYEYFIKETRIGEQSYAESDYVAVPVKNSFDIKNAIKESTTTEIIVKGTKTWVDDDDKYATRPEVITVNLLCDGKKVDSVNVKADKDGAWTYEFKDLPKYNMETGKLLEYTVEEEPVKWYAVTVNGHDVFNKLDEIPVPNMAVEKTQTVNDGKATSAQIEVKSGDVVTYTIKVTNKGENVIKDLVITDKLQNGFILKANSITGDGREKDGTLTWTVDSLEVGESVTVSFKVTVPKVEKDTTWKNVATVVCGNDPTDSEKPSNEVVLIETGEAPETSDHSPIVMWTTIMLTSIMFGGSVLLDKKRRREI